MQEGGGKVATQHVVVFVQEEPHLERETGGFGGGGHGGVGTAVQGFERALCFESRVERRGVGRGLRFNRLFGVVRVCVGQVGLLFCPQFS